MRKTVPVSSSSTKRKNAASESGSDAASVHTEAVSPYGESFISLIASSSEDTAMIPTTGPNVSSCERTTRRGREEDGGGGGFHIS